MSPRLPRPALLIPTLLALVPLTASAAPEELMGPEVLSLSREEISDEALRGVIGVARVFTGLDARQRPTGELPRFARHGDTFQPDGVVALEHLRAISERNSVSHTFRRLPVVGRHGDYVHVVIDAQTNERAWLHMVPRTAGAPALELLSFDDPSAWEGSFLELFAFAPQGQTRLYAAPRADARSHELSQSYPLRLRQEVVSTAALMSRQGNFVRIGALFDVYEPPVPLGWIPLTDERGVLLFWPMALQVC